MAKSPNITSISASFKIEYPNWPSTTGGQMTQIEPARTVSTEVANELARIDFMEQEISIRDIVPGQSYACKFRVETMLDEMDRIPGLSDTPLKGVGTYEGFGVLMTRDTKQELVEVEDQETKRTFVCTYDDIWDVDEVVWTKD